MVERNRDLTKKFRKVAKSLSYFDMHRISRRSSDLDLSSSDFNLSGDDDRGATEFFLGYYSLEGLYTILKRYGIFRALNKRGHEDFVIDLDFSDHYRQIFRLYCDGKKEPESMLGELVVQEGTLMPKQKGGRKERYDVIHIHWLTLQDPKREFSPRRPMFPDQQHPGLGIGHEVLELLIVMAYRLKKDGLLIYPEFFHNALLYRPSFMFYDPAREGFVNALDRDMGDRCLTEKAWLMYHECVIDKETGEYIRWQSHEQLLPIDKRIEKKVFESKRYRLARANSEMMHNFAVDDEKFARALEKEGPPLEWLLALRPGHKG